MECCNLSTRINQSMRGFLHQVILELLIIFQEVWYRCEFYASLKYLQRSMQT